tara:strand:+ start:769 stop:1578 length:810 start_codon:yes stop_codon:yes gene_type:complete
MAFTKTAGVEYGTPAVVLSTTAAAGSNQTAIRTDGQLIAFDATVPESIGASNGTGSAAVASRRDHTHAGVGAITSTDEAIARYNGTSGALQNYTSDAPTASDAGVITLASGQMIFPGTPNPSSDPNCLDQYEEGVFTPTLQDDSGSDSEGQTYTTQVGRYIKIGKMVHIQINLNVLGLGTLTISQYARVAGLPFTGLNVTGAYATIYSGYGSSLALTTAGGSVGGYVELNATHISMRQWSATGGVTGLLISNWTAPGQAFISCSYEAES